MTSLGIRYLTGYSVSANETRQGPEWPPHSGRVFMAMAAAHFETCGGPEEQAALKWLEEQRPAPAICASEASTRSYVETYVPVNDRHGGITGRIRQPRAFPTVRPVRDSVFLIWEADAPEHVRTGLERLCAKVTRVGHSSSLVQMWLADTSEDLEADWKPDEFLSEHRMRVAESGTLRHLEELFNATAIEEYGRLIDALELVKGKEKARLMKELQEKFPQGRPESVRPVLSRWQGYSRVRIQSEPQAADHGPFDSKLIVFTKEEGRVLGLESTLQLATALRNAAMKSAPNGQSPEWLSGHQTDGTPTLKPHIAFFPLPFVGADYADGHVMGMAIAIPRDFTPDKGETQDAALRKVIGPLLFDTKTGTEKQIELWRNKFWKWKLRREARDNPPATVRAQTWTKPSYEWASVTPVVLHHHPKNNRHGDVERILREAFASALLPEPKTVSVSAVSVFEGANDARSIPEFSDGGENLCRYQTHVVVRFAAPVQGPVLVGRGRFRGYGLFRPVGKEDRR